MCVTHNRLYVLEPGLMTASRKNQVYKDNIRMPMLKVKGRPIYVCINPPNNNLKQKLLSASLSLIIEFKTSSLHTLKIC